MNTSSPVGAVADKFDRFEVVLARRAVLRQKILRRQFVDKTPALNKHVELGAQTRNSNLREIHPLFGQKDTPEVPNAGADLGGD